MPERELSPYSARVALTQKLKQGQGNQPVPVEHQSRLSDSRGPPERGSGHVRSPAPRGGRREGRRPSPPSVRDKERDRSSPPKNVRDKERDRSSAPKSVRDRSPEERRRDTTSKDLSVQPSPPARGREASPEPYRKPREASRERKRNRSKERDRPRERRRSKDRDRSRDRVRTKEGDHSIDTTRTKHRARSTERDRSKGREGSKDRHREKRRSRSGERKREGLRERRRSRDRKRDRSKDRHRHRSRSRDRYRRRDSNHHRSRSRSRSKDHLSLKRRSPSSSPPPKRRRKDTRSRSPSPHRRSKAALPSQELSFRGLDNSAQPPTKYGGAPPNLQKPNFKPTGLLAKAANKVEGTKISLKYHEPAEARKPSSSQPWKIIVFKGEDIVDSIDLGSRSCWLLGRSAEVVDYVLEHPSSSGQHAVVQFRYVQKTVEDEFGVKKVKGKVKPYIIDLESSNGTELNGETIETSRFLELREKDILKFAGSEREYVVMLPRLDEEKA